LRAARAAMGCGASAQNTAPADADAAPTKADAEPAKADAAPAKSAATRGSVVGELPSFPQKRTNNALGEPSAVAGAGMAYEIQPSSVKQRTEPSKQDRPGTPTLMKPGAKDGMLRQPSDKYMQRTNSRGISYNLTAVGSRSVSLTEDLVLPTTADSPTNGSYAAPPPQSAVVSEGEGAANEGGALFADPKSVLGATNPRPARRRTNSMSSLLETEMEELASSAPAPAPSSAPEAAPPREQSSSTAESQPAPASTEGALAPAAAAPAGAAPEGAAEAEAAPTEVAPAEAAPAEAAPVAAGGVDAYAPAAVAEADEAVVATPPGAGDDAAEAAPQTG
jgi:hypothetical protein